MLRIASYTFYEAYQLQKVDLELCNASFYRIRNSMKALFLITTLFFLIQIRSYGQSASSQAKRAAPKEVPEIRYDSLILQRSGMEHVQALDSATKKILWKKKIYNVTYTPGLETDVQDVFIDSMYLRNRQLIIRNERKEWFSLDLQTFKVRRL
jgi:hypothetical protein